MEALFYKMLGNRKIYNMFCYNIFLFTIAIIINLVEMGNSAGSAGGWIIIISPVIVGIFLFPQVVGYIISRINISKNKYSLTILEFILSCFSLLSIILVHIPKDLLGFNGIFYWAALIQCIILVVQCLFKVILKENK